MSDSVICDDALAALRRQPDGSFAAVVTSPPYNLGWTNPPSKSGPGGVARAGRWRGSYDGHNDALPPDEYVAYHRAVLGELFRVLRSDGLLWYVHRRQPRFNPDGQPALVDRVLAGFPVRCEIIWDKGGPGVGFCAPPPPQRRLLPYAGVRDGLSAGAGQERAAETGPGRRRECVAHPQGTGGRPPGAVSGGAGGAMHRSDPGAGAGFGPLLRFGGHAGGGGAGRSGRPGH